MDARVRRIPYTLAVALLVLLPWSADAAPKDAAAVKIADEAINNDYLALRFADAVKKLKGAVAMCGGAACSAQVRARIHRDLGVVLIAGLKRIGEGKKELAEAVKADPGVTLDKDLTTPAVDQAFQAAKANAPAGATPAAPAGAQSSGDLIHTPAIEQAVLTPLPIYVEIPQGLSVAKVIALYKPFGAPDWQKLELRKIGGGYGGEIPCQAVGSTTGDLSYYVQAQDAEGDIVATSGTRKGPNKVPIQKELSGEAPHLPGRPAPAQCRDKADCPPGFPGCSSGSGGTSMKACDTNADCGTEQKCNADKVCESTASERKKLWISAHVQQDFSIVPSAQNVCGSPRNDPPTNFVCYDQDGYLYEGVPEETDPALGNGNEIKGKPRVSNTRLLLDLSYLVASNFTVGARVGYVLNTAPGRPLAKFHLEARVAYWIGNDPFAKHGLRPYLAVLGGIAEVDDKFSVQAFETLCKTDAECAMKGLQPVGGANPTLTVWRRGAKNFAGGAVGLMIPTAPNQGVVAEVKVQSFFPTTALTISPTAGYAFGF